MSSGTSKEYSVNWKNHMNHVRKAFGHLFNSEELTDVTLCCEGRKIGAHKMLLSACSLYFRDILKDVTCQRPVIILFGIEYVVLLDILHFIYNGEVSVDTSKLDCFLKTAQLLQISGLTDEVNTCDTTNKEHVTEVPHLEQDPDETCIEPTSSLENDNSKKSTKRQRNEEATMSCEKLLKRDEDALFISDVKCEPSELVSFEDPLEDPLQADHTNDGKELFSTTATTTIGYDELKYGPDKQPQLPENSHLVAKVGGSLSLNGYKYLVDKKRYEVSKVYWRCHRHRIDKCSGRLITDLDLNVIRVSAKHDHPPFVS